MATTDELSAKAKEVLEAGADKAKEILKSNEKVNELVTSGRAKVNGLAGSARDAVNNSDAAQNAMENLVLLLDMLEDYINGTYKAVPKNSIAAVVVAVLYWVNPFDLVPDVLPGVGLLDDAAVVAACVAFMGEDLVAYKKWKEGNKSDASLAGADVASA